MPDPFRRAMSGQPLVFSAEGYNAAVEAGFSLRRQQLATTVGDFRQRQPQTVLVRNDSGSDLARFGVLGIDGLVVEPADNEPEFRAGPVFKGITPTVAAHSYKFLIATEPIPDGKFGEALLTGHAVCKLDVGDADHTFASVKGSDRTQLVTGYGGQCPILYKQSGTGTKWGVVLLGPGAAAILLGKTDASHAKGASGTVSIWSGTAGSESDTGENLTAFNRFANVASGKWVGVVMIGQSYYLFAAEC